MARLKLYDLWVKLETAVRRIKTWNMILGIMTGLQRKDGDIRVELSL